MKFALIQKNKAPVMIVRQILMSLETGEIKPEEKLPPERELAKMFGVGRSSVREAIGVLVVMGFLEVIQGKGTYVRKDACVIFESIKRGDGEKAAEWMVRHLGAVDA